jgi:hypothetical protein
MARGYRMMDEDRFAKKFGYLGAGVTFNLPDRKRCNRSPSMQTNLGHIHPWLREHVSFWDEGGYLTFRISIQPECFRQGERP